MTPPPVDVAPTVLVSGAKGGVGKSTVAMLLACRLARAGLRVGLLDADLTTPTQSLLFDAHEPPRVRGGRMEPAVRHGVRLLSAGMFGESTTPFVWHGLALRGFLLQALRDVRWGDIDLLLVDMPAGTGETHVALLSLARVRAALLVTAQGAAAQADLLRLVSMLRRLEVPLLGAVTNALAPQRCPRCGHVGGHGEEAGPDVDVLGRLPWIGAGATLVAGGQVPEPAAAVVDAVAGRLREGVLGR